MASEMRVNNSYTQMFIATITSFHALTILTETSKKRNHQNLEENEFVVLNWKKYGIQNDYMHYCR